MTQGRIPESKMAEYARRKGWPDDISELFSHVLLGLDRAYLTWCQKERERKSARDRPPKP